VSVWKNRYLHPYHAHARAATRALISFSESPGYEIRTPPTGGLQTMLARFRRPAIGWLQLFVTLFKSTDYWG
jgi:hypothetical protein